MKRGGVPAALGTKERPGVEGGAVCPRKHPFQDPGQELTHVLPASTPYAPGASGFVVGWAGGVDLLGSSGSGGENMVHCAND